MALDYRKCAEEISKNIGGGSNVISAAHCATRLRLVIADNSKVNKSALEEVDGVKGMFESNGQLQLIIGTGTVNKVYDEFLSVTGASAASKDDVKKAAASRAPLWKRLLKTPGDVFVPILPAIVASGLMMGLVEALGKAIPTFASTDWYAFLDMAANTAFAFLPVLVAISSARVFGGNIFLGGVIGLMMVHGGLLNAWNAGSAENIAKFFGIEVGGVNPYLVTDWSGVTVESIGGIPSWKLLFFNVPRTGYQGHVIPVIIAVWLMSMLEKWLHKHVPEMIDLFVTPLCTVLATAFVTFTIIGPIFAQLESWVLIGAQQLITIGFGIGSMLMGALYPITVVMGLHHMYNVIEAGMLSAGEGALNTWMPIASAANFAQFGACLAVALKAKNLKTKSVAVPSSLSAALGITEPAIFGINFRFMKPFVAGMIGGAVGSLIASWTKIGAKAYGVTGIPGYLTIDNAVLYTLVIGVAAAIAFAITFVIWKEDAPKAAPKAAKPEVDMAAQPVVMKVGAEEIKAPAVGSLVKQADIPDPMFAEGALGAGLAIKPTQGIIVAPCAGTISTVAETKHAVGISTEGGLELLIHVGVDTVKMGGKGFQTFVNEGDTITPGQKLLTFNRQDIKEAGYPDDVVFLLTNSDDFGDVQIFA